MTLYGSSNNFTRTFIHKNNDFSMTIYKIIKIAIMALILHSTNVVCNAECKLHPEIEIGRLIGIIEYSKLTYDQKTTKHQTIQAGNNLTSNRAHLNLIYKFSPRISAGLGSGLDAYNCPSYNTMPIFASLSYYPIISKSLFTTTNIGYSICISDDFYKGYLFDLGLGYQFKFKEHFGLKLKLYYNVKQFIYNNAYCNYNQTLPNKEVPSMVEYKTNNWRHSIGSSVSLTF